LLVFAGVDRIVTAAMQAGWEPRPAFDAAMMLVACGVTVDEAERAFIDAARRLQ
jgi:hypothetical protein